MKYNHHLSIRAKWSIILHLDYSIPGHVVADKKKKEKLHPLTGFEMEASTLKELLLPLNH